MGHVVDFVHLTGSRIHDVPSWQLRRHGTQFLECQLTFRLLFRLERYVD